MLVVVVLLLASSIAYVFREQVIMVVLEPYAAASGDQRLMYLNPAGGFSFIFLVTLYAAIAVTIPALRGSW